MKIENVTRRVADGSVIIGLTLVLGWAFVWAEPARRGFYCDDETIQYPYRKDTVTFRMILVMICPIPLLIVFFIETLAAFTCSHFTMGSKTDTTSERISVTTDLKDDSTSTSQNGGGRAGAQRRRPGALRLILVALRNTGRVFLLFWFGIIITMCITEVGKLGVGRLRPHFLAVCRPAGFNCSQGYVTDYTCTNELHKVVLQARKSFPSGHASGITFAAFFLALYIQKRVPGYRATGSLLKPMLQAALMAVAFYTGISRVHDNMHHPQDVAVGTLIGLVVAGWMMLSVHRRITYITPTCKGIVCRTDHDVV